MSEFTVARTLKAQRDEVWQALTQARDFERWLPAKEGTAVLDVRTGGSWQAVVVSSAGQELPLSGRYDEVHEPDRLVMTVPGDVVAAIRLTATGDTTEIAYTFDVDAGPHGVIEAGVDDVLGKVSQILADRG